MPDVDPVDYSVRNKAFPRYKAPHVANQPPCLQKSESLPGKGFYSNATSDQPIYGCDESCNNGCVPNQPSIHNPGPSFANSTHSVELIRVHKANVHFTCTRALLILQRKVLTDLAADSLERHKYALARVLMKPAPASYAWEHQTEFRRNIAVGNYSRNATGVWQMWQTGTIGLRSMDVSSDNMGSGPNPGNLKFFGVTDDRMRQIPGHMNCWDPNCLGQLNCWSNVAC